MNTMSVGDDVLVQLSSRSLAEQVSLALNRGDPKNSNNAVAVGLADKTVKPKLSKACDIRWHWLQDRVGQGRFRVQYISGIINVSD
jgi:hypothetical protein